MSFFLSFLIRLLLDIMDRLAAAREAFQKGDTQTTLLLHNKISDSNTNHHGNNEHHLENGSEIIKIGVFGGLDGIITIFCFLAAGHGGGLSLNSMIWLGLGNLLGDAVSMAISEYLSSSNEAEFNKSELLRESWEMYNCPEGELAEMVEIYMDRYQFTEEDAKTVVDIHWKYPEYFLHNMMVEELGILVDDDGLSYHKKALIMFFSFVFFGAIPLASYSAVMIFFGQQIAQYAFGLSAVLSATTVFILGAFAASFSHGEKVNNGLKMSFGAVLAGTCAYAFGNVAQIASTQWTL